MDARGQAIAQCKKDINEKDAEINALKEHQGLAHAYINASFRNILESANWNRFAHKCFGVFGSRAFMEQCIVHYEMTHYREEAPIMQDKDKRARVIDLHNDVLSDGQPYVSIIFEQTFTPINKIVIENNACSYEDNEIAFDCLLASASLMQTCKMAYNIGKVAGFPKKSQDACKAKLPKTLDSTSYTMIKFRYNEDLNKF